MKVWELAAEKKQGMSEDEFTEFVSALAYQYGVFLAAAGIKDIGGIERDELLTALFDREVKVIGEDSFIFKDDFNTDPIVTKYRKAAAN
jgi:hypothetical protein